MGDPSTPRPTPAASGTLAKTPFVHLLLYALDKKLGGSVELKAPQGDRSAVVLFIEGHPAKVRTSEAVAYLGQVLHELGRVTEEQLTRSLAELAASKAQRPTLHGELLLERGVIDASMLEEALAEQLARKLRYIAALPSETTFAYYEGFDALETWGAPVARGVDPMPLLWPLLREHAPWEHVQAALARVTASPLRLGRGADVARMRLGQEEAAAAELLRTHPVRASELGKAAHLNERTAQLLAYLLLVTKQVDVLPALEPKAPLTSKAAPASASAVASSERSVAAMAAPARAVKATAVRAKAASVPHIPSTLNADATERWNEIVGRAATIDRVDYFTMLDIARDANGETIRLAFFALAKRWHPDRLPLELAPLRDACSRVFSRMSEAHATLSDEKQRARYMKLLADGSGTPEMQETVAKVVEAATDFQKAEVFFRKNDLVQAEAYCRRALEADSTQASYLALLAWLVAMKPENQSPEKMAHCIQMLDRAIALNERLEKGHFWRGMLYKRLGRIEIAMRDFKRAAEINPRNIDAARELRLFHMRGGHIVGSPPDPKEVSPEPVKAEEPKKPHLLSRLFKKT
ncbi:MAG: DnaJ domain-containing protein [Myxococcota bacterium]|nr:DnaJ domain-containing protein [Myxococcota bacterium]